MNLELEKIFQGSGHGPITAPSWQLPGVLNLLLSF
jgi:hypothetical protein